MSSLALLELCESASSRKSKNEALRRSARGFARPRRKANQPREEVAAVCYRIHESRLEFLLVQTRRGGRWIFPKGGVERGLTRSQSAALEALEEAGVHGSIEEAPFTRYAAQERDLRKNPSGNDLTIAAYLCAVTWLTTPHEAKRNPTWFSPEKAKKRLMKDRERRFGRELCRVVDRAVIRVQRLQSYRFAAHDVLRKTCFEASEPRTGFSDWQETAAARLTTLIPSIRATRLMLNQVVMARGSRRPMSKPLQLGPGTGWPGTGPFASLNRQTRASGQKTANTKKERTHRG
jgi:8-oxo-dGTP pyrophosphatase MutT (NUDIX family)